MPTRSSAALHALLALGGAHAAVGERQLDVLEHREVADQVEALEDEPDLAVADRAPARTASSCSTGRPFSKYLPSVGVSSRPRIDSSVDLPQPDGPGDRHVLALLDLEVDPRQGVGLDFVRVEDLLQVVERDERAAGVQPSFYLAGSIA